MFVMIKSMFQLAFEQIRYFPMTVRLAAYDTHANNAHKYLGSFWEILDPLFQVLTYAVIFGGGFQSRAPQEGLPYFVWMSVGFTAWYLVNQGFSDTIRSIQTQIFMVRNVKFPVSILPSIRVVQVTPAVLSISVVAGISMAVTGHFHISVYWLQIFYYLFAALVMLFFLGLFSATINILIPDYDLAIRQVLRLLFFVSGILFEPVKGGTFQTMIYYISRVNPFYYIVNGWRETFLTQQWFWNSPSMMAIFWLEILFFAIVGSHLYLKFKDQLIDFI
ncbi:phosphate ABC transporter permease [Weissella confusa]|uniref:ABC transporter permease n=3 Tax=Weissella confusa TaxID=1583 RepID=A0A329G5B2_WEICO|nr:ABC transporter permease [Weissella confusa]MBA5932674.1 ABC transporter permease [Weissella confusa]MBC6499550.1 ABC transporter permease [Weissella confusa]MBF7055259.1 ABC transporter permease [Weissella confusa]MBJ7617619.1 ABC transporter permease [Weissella confusa]MBJ7625166.1 ABC transporter permease [Weissella confusa]